MISSIIFAVVCTAFAAFVFGLLGFLAYDAFKRGDKPLAYATSAVIGVIFLLAIGTVLQHYGL